MTSTFPRQRKMFLFYFRKWEGGEVLGSEEKKGTGKMFIA
jgi:hypothetical protein